MSVRKKGGSGGGGGRSGRSKKGKIDRNSDARCRCSRSNSVRDVRCEEQEKTWTVVWGSKQTGGAEKARDQS